MGIFPSFAGHFYTFNSTTINLIKLCDPSELFDLKNNTCEPVSSCSDPREGICITDCIVYSATKMSCVDKC